jgi:voltage-dependent calcium channel
MLDVPEIVVVEDMPSTPPPPVSSRDITSAIRRLSAGTTMTSWTEPETPTRRDQQFELSDLQVTPPIGGGGSSAGAGSSSSRGLRRDRRVSDMSAVSADLGLRYTYVVFELCFVDLTQIGQTRPVHIPRFAVLN